MKKMSVMAAMFGLLTLASCGKNDDTAPASYVTYDGKKFELSDVSTDDNSDDTNWDLTIISSSLNLSGENISISSTIFAPKAEVGETVVFEGFDANDAGQTAYFTAVNATVYNYSTGENPKNDIPTGGSITVTGLGKDSMTIEYDLEFANDKTLTGSYSGPVSNAGN